MAALPHVSSAESIFHEALDVSQILPRLQQQPQQSGFSTAMSLDFQDKFVLERSLPSYSTSSGGFQLVGSTSWDQSQQQHPDTHFFTSNADALQASAAAAAPPQHEILVDWQQMGDFATSLGSVSSGMSRSGAALSNGTVVELSGRIAGLSGTGTGTPSTASSLRSSPHDLLAPDQTKGGCWNSAAEAAASQHHGGHPFMPFGNGNPAAPFSLIDHDEEKAIDHLRSGAASSVHLCQSDSTKLQRSVADNTKVEASVDETSSGAKSMLETSQVSVVKETTGRKRRTSSSDKLKDAGSSCVTSTGIKDGEEIKGKRQKNPVDMKEESSKQQGSDNSASTSPKSVKENSKPVAEPPKDYIHVRARRGQATDSHSLAERVRREKISERMKFLQDLVPGCNKVTGKAVMLDEIINYVQSLQRQVEFLSMKLAAVNPRLEFSVESLLGKEVPHGRTSPTHFVLGLPQSYSQQLHQAQHNALQLAGLDLRSITGLQDAAIRRGTFDPYNTSDPIPQTSVWDGELQNIVHMMGFVETGP